MTWCFSDEVDPYAEQILDLLKTDGFEAVVPVLWSLEVANVLLVAERRQRLTPAQSDTFFDLIGTLPITVEVESLYVQPREVIRVGRRQGLTAYDASYFGLAERRECSIATIDRKMRAAAVERGILFQPTRVRKPEEMG